MNGFAKREKCVLKGAVDASDLKTKCITLLVYEEEGKTVLQPVGTEQETQEIQELFKNSTLEVWLSNGKSNVAEYDVSILKYTSQLQHSPFADLSEPKHAFFPLSSYIGKKWG